MKKNALLIFSGLAIIFLIYQNYELKSNLTTLDNSLIKNEFEIDSLRNELMTKNNEVKELKSVAEIWASRAHSSGYKNPNTIKIDQKSN